MPWPDVIDLFTYWGRHPPLHETLHALGQWLGAFKAKEEGQAKPEQRGMTEADLMELRAALG